MFNLKILILSNLNNEDSSEDILLANSLMMAMKCW